MAMDHKCGQMVPDTKDAGNVLTYQLYAQEVDTGVAVQLVLNLLYS